MTKNKKSFWKKIKANPVTIGVIITYSLTAIQVATEIGSIKSSLPNTLGWIAASVWATMCWVLFNVKD